MRAGVAVKRRSGCVRIARGAARDALATYVRGSASATRRVFGALQTATSAPPTIEARATAVHGNRVTVASAGPARVEDDGPGRDRR